MSTVAIITKRIDYYDRYFLIVPNIAAGRKGRYTVYRIPTSCGQRVRIIGRELTLADSKRIVREHQGA